VGLLKTFLKRVWKDLNLHFSLFVRNCRRRQEKAGKRQEEDRRQQKKKEKKEEEEEQKRRRRRKKKDLVKGTPLKCPTYLDNIYFDTKTFSNI